MSSVPDTPLPSSHGLLLGLPHLVTDKLTEVCCSHTSPCCPMVRHSISEDLTSHQEVYAADGRVLLPKPRGLNFHSALRLATNPMWHLFLLLTPPPRVPDCVVPMAGCLPHNPHLLQSPFPALGHLKLAAFWVAWHGGQSSGPWFGVCCFQGFQGFQIPRESKDSHQVFCFHHYGRSFKIQSFVFYFVPLKHLWIWQVPGSS